MSEVQAPPQPEARPPVSRAEYYCVIVADTEGSPELFEASTLEGLKDAIYKRVVTLKAGWCYPFIKGQPAYLSAPSQVFQLKLPDGSLTRVEDPSQGVFEANGRFSTLQSSTRV